MIINEDIEEIIFRSKNSLNKIDGSKILITGASGFIGQYFIEVFKKINVEVVAIDNNLKKENINVKNIKWIEANAKISDCIDEKFDYIIHLAGIASPQNYKLKPLETIYSAVDITRLLLEKSKKDKSKFLFFSSSEIYGDPAENFIPTPESYFGNVSTLGPRSCYDESKRLGETLCYIYKTEFDTKISIVRPFNIYGPGILSSDLRVLPNFANSLIKNEKIKIYGNGKQTRTFCYITDAMVGFLKVLIDSNDPYVFNVGAEGPEISMIDFANKCCKIFNNFAEYEIIPYPESYPGAEPFRRCPDISLIKKELNYKAIVSLDEGLNRFFLWAKENYLN